MKFVYELRALPYLNTEGTREHSHYIASKEFRLDQLLKRSEYFLQKDYESAMT